MLRDFATKDEPLRMSALTSLKSCPGSVVMAIDAEDSGGKAADTGTAVGLMIELFHRGLSVADCVRQAAEGAEDGLNVAGEQRGCFPEADIDLAGKWFERYARDPRNPRNAVVKESLEVEVTLTLDPLPEDPTGKPIFLVGHIDQIRPDPDDGIWEVWDVKSGCHSGDEMVLEYAWQQAAYTLGAAQLFKRPVRWGGIINVRGYEKQILVPNPKWTHGSNEPRRKRKKPTPGQENVFFRSPFSHDDLLSMMNEVRKRVAAIRRGAPALNIGDQCRWCAAGSFSNCATFLPQIEV